MGLFERARRFVEDIREPGGLEEKATGAIPSIYPSALEGTSTAGGPGPSTYAAMLDN